MSEAASSPPALRRLRAVTRRVPRRLASPSDGDEGSEEDFAPEPNPRLSRALGVMLLLHVVAAGGVLAFGKIKERAVVAPPGTDRVAKGTAHREDHVLPTEVSPGPDHAPTPYAVAVPSAPPVAPRNVAARPLSTPALSRVETDAVRLIESGGPNAPGGVERTYVVGRGETVQTIAQKLRVEPAALLRLNRIDDPRQIQVGQRLRVPAPPGGRSRS